MEPLLLNLVLCAGSALMLCFLFLFDVPKVNLIANKWLGAFYFCLACVFYQLYFYRTGSFNEYPVLVHMLELSTWVVMPCFYYAVLKFTDPEHSTKRAFLHLIPAFVFLLFSLRYFVPGCFGSPQELPQLPIFLRLLFRYFFTVQLVVYWVLSYKKLLAHKNYLLQVASSIERVDLSWLKNLMIASLVMILLRFIPNEAGIAGKFLPLFYFLGMISLGYYSIRQEPIYAVALFQAVSVDQQESKEIFERLEVRQVEALQARIVKLTSEKKLYLDPSLSLPALSNALDIGVQDLSYVLNNGLGKNFYQFINELRVEEAKLLLESDKAKKLDMLGIATHAGFNSKTTFNTTFKKVTGLTPSQYMKAHSLA